MHTSPMHAAERSAASSLLTPQNQTGKVSVVRIDRSTGKLIRAESAARPVVVARFSPPPAALKSLVNTSARNYGVDPLLVQSVIQVESGYNQHAISPKGAEGLMQLMPRTARELGVGNAFDPAQNIEAGVRYLKQLQDIYHDDRLALAAYNAGPHAVDKFKQIPPYRETESYVEQVGSRYRAAQANAQAESLRGEGPLAPATAPEYKEDRRHEEEKHPKLEQFVDDQGRLYLKTAAE